VLVLTQCDIVDGVRDRLSSALSVPASQFSDVQGSQPCSGKRQGSFSSFSFNVEGSPTESSQAISSKLSSLQSSNHISLSGNGVGASSVGTAPSGVEATPVEALPIEAAVAIAAAGLSVIVIAAIVVGSVVVAAGATAGTVIAVKKLRAPKPEPEAEVPLETPRKPKKGVDIYNFDPENITSITARGVPQPVDQ